MKDRVVHVLIGVLGLSWLYYGAVYYIKHPTIFDFVGVLNFFGIGLAILAVSIAVHYFTSKESTSQTWLLAAWAVASLAFKVLRGVYEGQKDYAGKLILLGTLVLMMVIAMFYMLRRQLTLRQNKKNNIEDG